MLMVPSSFLLLLVRHLLLLAWHLLLVAPIRFAEKAETTSTSRTARDPGGALLVCLHGRMRVLGTPAISVVVKASISSFHMEVAYASNGQVAMRESCGI